MKGYILIDTSVDDEVFTEFLRSVPIVQRLDHIDGDFRFVAIVEGYYGALAEEIGEIFKHAFTLKKGVDFKGRIHVLFVSEQTASSRSSAPTEYVLIKGKEGYDVGELGSNLTRNLEGIAEVVALDRLLGNQYDDYVLVLGARNDTTMSKVYHTEGVASTHHYYVVERK